MYVFFRKKPSSITIMLAFAPDEVFIIGALQQNINTTGLDFGDEI